MSAPSDPAIPKHLAPQMAALEAMRDDVLRRYVRAVEAERLPGDAVLRVLAYAVGEIGGVAAMPESRELALSTMESALRDGFRRRVLAHSEAAGSA